MNVVTVTSYKVEFETDRETGSIVVSIPSLNYTADFGRSVEKALRRLRKLAAGYLELLVEEGERVPQSDPPAAGVFLSLPLPRRAQLSR